MNILSAKQHNTSKLKLLASVMVISVCVTGCLGDKQPPRHNQVVGEKHVPVLNQQTAQPNVPFPTDEMLYAMPPEAKQGLQPRTNWEEPVAPVVSQAPSPQNMQALPNMQANMGNAGLAGDAIAPSPLYYYEQQNAAVGASDLASSPLGQAPLASSPLASQTLEQAPAVAPSPLGQNVNVVEAPMKQVVMSDENAKLTTDYPKLNDVPQKQELVDKKQFTNAKSDADKFIAQQKQGEAIQKQDEAAIPAEPQFEELTLDEFLAKEAVNEEIATKEDISKEDVSVKQVAKQYNGDVVTSSDAQIMDYSKQPLMAVEAPSLAQTDISPAPVQQSPAMIEPFADANSKQEIAKEMAKQPSNAAISSAIQSNDIVEVKDAAPVTAMPRNQKLYTSSGVIELVPPSSIASRPSSGGTYSTSGRRELPRSRYYNRRYSTNRD